MAEKKDVKSDNEAAAEEKAVEPKKKVTKKKVAKKKTAKKKVAKKAAKKTVAEAKKPVEETVPVVPVVEDPPMVDPDTVAPILAETAAPAVPAESEETKAEPDYDKELVEKLQAIGVVPDETESPSKEEPAAGTSASSGPPAKGANFLFGVLYSILIIGAVLLYLFAVYLPDEEGSSPGHAVAPHATQPASPGGSQLNPPAGREDTSLRPVPKEQLELLNKTFAN